MDRPHLRFKGVQKMLKDILCFHTFLLPKVITFLYLVASVAVIICGLSMAFYDMDNMWKGLAMAILGPLVIRLYAEVLVVIFNINSNLQKIADRK
jgi:hypothetical protein